MFDIKDYVFYSSEGICQIDDIVSSPFSDVKTDVKYYVLHSTHGGNNTAYVPVDRAESLVRRLMTKSETDALLDKIDGLQVFKEENLKLLKNTYIEAIRSGNPLEWVRVIKTVYGRTVNGRENGKKVSDAERALSESAERFLYKEISIILGISETEAGKYVSGKIAGLSA